MNKLEKTQPNSLLTELSFLIEQCQQQIVSQANSTLTLLFWQVGKRINEDILQHKRADYGKQIVSTVSAQLKERYGRNFELGNLRRMMQFAEQFPDLSIVVPLARQLSWSHFTILIPIKNQEAKLFYANLAAEASFGKRELRKQISSKTFESSREQIELLEMHKDGIMVAEYWTELPPKKQFEQKIHSILIEARERIARNTLNP